MIEIILLVVILILCGLIGWMDYNNRKERKSLVNAILAKTPQELVNLELADKTKIEAKPTAKDDLIDTSTLSDEEYERMITNAS